VRVQVRVVLLLCCRLTSNRGYLQETSNGAVAAMIHCSTSVQSTAYLAGPAACCLRNTTKPQLASVVVTEFPCSHILLLLVLLLLQAGGSDQWGNITAGTDLIRKLMSAEGQEPPQCFGLTFPLLVRDGGGAAWCSLRLYCPTASTYMHFACSSPPTE
jgi:hypothetical protein